MTNQDLECGECQTHLDCVAKGDDAKCVHQKNGTNICIAKCQQTDTSDHGFCNEDGEWKCHQGYEGDKCTEREDCQKRCLNGSGNSCETSKSDCNCVNGFHGKFCEKHPCDPG